jgi:hypothetical protein
VNGEGKGGMEYRYLKMDEYVRRGGGEGVMTLICFFVSQ